VLKLCIAAMILGVMTASAWAQLDVAKLAEAYKAYDMARNEGKGSSENPDSSSLGWGEGGIIHTYALMWEVTEDTYWLTKISEHFHNIVGTASDPEGDGYLSWATKAYSTAVAYAERLHNVSDATITPASQINRNGKAAAECTGHKYIIDFHNGPEEFRILDWDTRQLLVEGVEHKDGAEITQIVPFKFKISGQTHQGDRFMIRTYAPESVEYVVHQGMFIYPVAKFIEAVKARPDLQEQFGADADEFLAFINQHVFEHNEQDWIEMGDRGGAYREQATFTARDPNVILPHNQYGALARAWLVLKDVEGAHPLMADRAEKMARYFHSYLELDEEKNAYKWHYMDWILYGEPKSSGYEDTSHGHIDVSLAVEAARRGVVFTDEDMVRMANTWLKVMWNQDEDNPLMASRVDGSEPFNASALLLSWSELSQWDKQVYDLALKAFLAKDEQQQARWAPAMLLCAKRAGVELPGMVGEGR